MTQKEFAETLRSTIEVLIKLGGTQPARGANSNGADVREKLHEAQCALISVLQDITQ